MFKYDYIDVSKLEFKKEIAEAGRIMIRINSLNRMHPISKDVFFKTVENGNHHDKVKNLCTPESIKKATKKPSSKPKPNNNES